VPFLRPLAQRDPFAPTPQAPEPPASQRLLLFGPASDDAHAIAQRVAARHNLPIIDLPAVIARRAAAAAAAIAAAVPLPRPAASHSAAPHPPAAASKGAGGLEATPAAPAAAPAAASAGVAAAQGGPRRASVTRRASGSSDPAPILQLGNGMHRHSLAVALHSHLSKGEPIPRRLLVRTALVELAALHVLRSQKRPVTAANLAAWDHLADPVVATAAEAAEAQATALAAAVSAAVASAQEKAAKKKLTGKKEADFIAVERAKVEAEWAKRAARAAQFTDLVESCAEAAEADLDPEEVTAMSGGVDADPHARFSRGALRFDMSARTGFAAALGGGLSAATLGHATRLSHVVPSQVE
jgi:hypothetical protein